MKIRKGVNLERSAQEMRSLANDVQNIRSGGGGITPGQVRSDYLNWIERARGQLQNCLAAPEALDLLSTGNYWHIRNNWGDPRPYDLIYQDCELQKTRMNDLAAYLDLVRAFVTARGIPPVTFAVPDTNVLLRAKPYRELRWLDLTGERSLRVVVPLKVVEELDRHKNEHRDPNIRQRARAVVRQLWADISSESLGLKEVGPGVTIEVPVGLWPSARTEDADEQILWFASQIQDLDGRVLVITNDIGMSIRATKQGLAVKQLRDEDLPGTSYLRAGESTGGTGG